MNRLALLAALLCACREQAEPEPSLEVAHYAALPSNKLDVLFQIDNSESVGDLQAAFAGALLPLLGRISDFDLHIGVITSDLGTSSTTADPAPSIGNCGDRGDDGELQLTGAPVMDTYLVDEADGLGGRRRNYSGDLAAVLGQMVRVGSGGCSFEQPLAATTRALANPLNTGFARNDANLLVVMLMDEDDCSVRAPHIFGPESTPLGPRSSAHRCPFFGIECDEPLTELGPKTNCRPSSDTTYIEGIEPFVDAMRIVRGSPARVGVAAVAAPPDVTIAEIPPPGGGIGIPQLAHSCRWDDATGGSTAGPAVRVAAAIDALAPNSSFSSVCSSDLSPASIDIARVANGLRGITCLDTARFGPEPRCSVTIDGETPLSLCPATGDCFEIVEDAAACGDRPRLVVNLAAPTVDQFVRARCVLAEPSA